MRRLHLALLSLLIGGSIALAGLTTASAQSPAPVTYRAQTAAGRTITLTVDNAARRFVYEVRNPDGSLLPAAVQTWTITNQSTGAARPLTSETTFAPGTYSISLTITARLGRRAALDRGTVENVVFGTPSN